MRGRLHLIEWDLVTLEQDAGSLLIADLAAYLAKWAAFQEMYGS